MILILNQQYWDKLKAWLKVEYPNLTDTDLYSAKGKEEEMLRMVEYKLRKSKVEMKKIISCFDYS